MLVLLLLWRLLLLIRQRIRCWSVKGGVGDFMGSFFRMSKLISFLRFFVYAFSFFSLLDCDALSAYEVDLGVY